jgi:hypothetical protein
MDVAHTMRRTRARWVEDAEHGWRLRGEDVEIERPYRKVTIQYRYVDGRFYATSPDLTRFDITGLSLYQITQLERVP